jgi:outer membrane murein-binding lipoprotein Lpp
MEGRHMRRVLLMTAIVGMLALAACAGLGQRDALLVAVDTYTAAVETLSDLQAAGVADVEDVARIEPYRVAARAALDAWREAVESGGDTETTSRVAQDAVSILRDVLVAINEEGQTDGND